MNSQNRTVLVVGCVVAACLLVLAVGMVGAAAYVLVQQRALPDVVDVPTPLAEEDDVPTAVADVPTPEEDEPTPEADDPTPEEAEPTPEEDEPTPEDQDVPASDFLPEIARVSVDTAYQAFVDGTAVFVDARDPSLYDEQHIPGALSLPYYEIETRLGELDPDDWIITYCI